MRTTVLLLLLLAMPFAASRPLLLDDDAGSGRDAPDDLSFPPTTPPVPITAGTWEGRHLPLDSRDWYTFEANRGQGLVKRVTTTSGQPANMIVLDSQPHMLSDHQMQGSLIEESGAHFIEVSSNVGTATFYEFTIEILDLPLQNDAGLGEDADARHLRTVGFGDIQGQLTPFDYEDVYQVVPPPSLVSVSLVSAENPALRAYVSDSTDTQLADILVGSSVVVSGPGPWEVGVWGNYHPPFGNYTLMLSSV